MTILTETNYVDKAEKIVQSLNKKNDKFILTTSQIRNILSSTSHLFDKVKYSSFEDVIGDIKYLQVQVIYQASRQYSVKDFVNKAELLDILKEVNSIESIILFCRYMEALVAYFKYYGGND
ncbi:type III-A CRISPR-associated protein Csm2 [Globicatella sanguinis]|uniref:type III-A CRISPR-associated protein Csm2 n=1 Tax=Globicatella sanguinis TaxID=13076 RepID=UPI0025432148|nr:type III-A CRISPR-associated protein Csm2 [Globicatella sanguinis]MDK7630762.1 type III-A CRISPR-associated protein Csm2 [Globicatella sanguinis]WIK66789.1 type III-A CRISPR-associated protein Csm2 [Globicatella sanguinis]WKT56194.1 type III-A CRISPR-associated protein Csm2 [Globicatella sanguinis]